MPTNFRDLLYHWSLDELAQALNVKISTVSAMRSRGSVAPRYWRALIVAAKARGLVITTEMLARWAEERKREREAA